MRVNPRDTSQDEAKRIKLEIKTQRITKWVAIILSFLIIYFLFIKLLFL